MNKRYRDRGISIPVFCASLGFIKSKLAQLADSQRELKKILRQPHGRETWKYQWSLRANRVVITALLNLFADVRGKQHVHSYKKHCGYVRTYDSLSEQYEAGLQLLQEASVAALAVATGV